MVDQLDASFKSDSKKVISCSRMKVTVVYNMP